MNPSGVVEECVRVVRARWPQTPRVAIILGTGLGGLAEHVEAATTVAYSDLPGFPQPTAISHQGHFIGGSLAGLPVLTLQGRVHYYEGFNFDQITLPVRVAAALGCQTLVVSNASGGLNPRFRSGDLMVLAGHIDLMGCRNRFAQAPSIYPIASGRTPYDEPLAERALAISRHGDFACHRGVYVAVTGPNYETRAEYRFMRRLGGDAVGMSTVPEVIAAHLAGLRVLALSAITNVARPDAPDTVDALEVVDLARHAEPKLRAIVLGIVEYLAREPMKQRL